MLFSPRPVTSKARLPAAGIRRGNRTRPHPNKILWFCVDLRLSFAYSCGDFSGDADASAYETAAGNPRLPERVHPTTRLCAEPRGNWPQIRPLVARDGAQAPHEPPGKRLQDR